MARVVTSHLEGFEAGDIIFGLHHWEDYSLSDANTILLSKLSPEPDIPLLLLRWPGWIWPHGLCGAA